MPAPFTEWTDDELWTLHTELAGNRPGKTPYQEELHGEGHNLAHWYAINLAAINTELEHRGMRLRGNRFELPRERDARLRRHIHAVSE